jgi:hypothetical protein
MKGIWLVAGVLLAAAAGAWAYGALFPKDDGSQLIFNAPEAIFYGVPFTLRVGVSNNGSDVWRDAAVTLALSDNFAFASGPTGALMVKPLGDLGPGSLTETAFEIVALPGAGGDEYAAGPVRAELSYGISSTKARFEHGAEWPAPMPAPALAAAITGPAEAAGGAPAAFTVSYENISPETLDDMSVAFAYPAGFTPERSSAEELEDASFISLGSLRTGSKDSITIRGRAYEAAEGAFGATFYRTINGARQAVARVETPFTVLEPPFAVGIDLKDDPEYVARLGETLPFIVSYSANDARPPRNLTVRVSFVGELFDFATLAIQDGGVVERNQKTGAPEIVWRGAPYGGEGGAVRFSIRLKQAAPARRAGDRDFSVGVRAEVMNKDGAAAAEIAHKVLGSVAFSARAYFRDAAAGVVNSGSMPPKVGAETQYTVHWTIGNYTNAMRGVTARARLAPGVRFISAVKSTTAQKPAFDAATGEVVWAIDRLAPSAGIGSGSVEAVFQIAAKPAASDAGRHMALIGESTFVATDDFADAGITASAPAITTLLPDDPTVANAGIVAQ